MNGWTQVLKAIQTWYRGYKTRSRLEARWMVFFDSSGVKFEYEREGYDLNGLWYLPDFWLPDHNCWIEIKGQEPDDTEIEKAARLCLHSGQTVYIFVGEPYDNVSFQSWQYIKNEDTKSLHIDFDDLDAMFYTQAEQAVDPAIWPGDFRVDPKTGDVAKEVAELWGGAVWNVWIDEGKVLTTLSAGVRTKAFGRLYRNDEQRLYRAYVDARSARFERQPVFDRNA